MMCRYLPIPGTRSLSQVFTGSSLGTHPVTSEYRDSGRIRLVTSRSQNRGVTNTLNVFSYTSIANEPPARSGGSRAWKATDTFGQCWSTPRQKTRSNIPDRRGIRQMSAWSKCNDGARPWFSMQTSIVSYSSKVTSYQSVARVYE